MVAKRTKAAERGEGRSPVKNVRRKASASPRRTNISGGALFAELRQVTGWSRVQIANRLACSEGLLRRMEADETAVPAEVLDWLTKVAEAIKSLPPPRPEVWKAARPRPDADARAS